MLLHTFFPKCTCFTAQLIITVDLFIKTYWILCFHHIFSVCNVGQSWAAASSEGLVVYSLESHDVFDPFQLECNVTSERICQASSNKEHTKALILSLRLNEPELICQVMEAVEPCDSKF